MKFIALLFCAMFLPACTGPVFTIGYTKTVEKRPDGVQVTSYEPHMASQRLMIGGAVTAATNSPLFGVISTVAGEAGDTVLKYTSKPLDGMTGDIPTVFRTQALGPAEPITTSPKENRRN